MMSGKNRQAISWNWKRHFSSRDLEGGKTLLRKQQLSAYKEGDRSISGYANGFLCSVKDIPDSYTSCEEDNRRVMVTSKNMMRNYKGIHGNIYGNVSEWQCTCSLFENGSTCRHLAALLLYREKLHGDLTFRETDEEMEARMQKEEKERLARLAEEEKKRKQQNIIKAADIFKDLKIRDDAYFNVRNAVQGFTTDEYERDVYSSVKSPATPLDAKISLSEEDGQILTIKSLLEKNVIISMSADEIISAECDCGASYTKLARNRWYYSSGNHKKHLCGHMLGLLREAARYIEKNNPGDATDLYGERFLRSVQNETSEITTPQEVKPEKKKEITLEPRVVREESGDFNLTFTAGISGGKGYVVRNLSDMVQSWQNERSYKLSSKAELDFRVSDFTDEAEVWLTLLAGKKNEIADYNTKLNRSSSWYYTPVLSMSGEIALKNSVLDQFYDATEGTTVNFIDRKEGCSSSLAVNDFPFRIHMKITPIRNENAFLGIKACGDLPALIRGNQAEYVYSAGKLGRVTPARKAVINHLQFAAKSKDEFYFKIGINNLEEFYFRILPALTRDDTVIVHDEAEEEVKRILPPEPSFEFYADSDDGLITIRPVVQYGDSSYELIESKENPGFIRDTVQEKRVITLLNSLSDYSEESGFFIDLADSDTVSTFLSQGIDLLSQFGPVHGSQAFYSYRTRPVPRITTSVSVNMESGLLDLQIKTEDLTPDELLRLLKSYRLKRKYHRLKSGDFIDLSDTEPLHEIDTVLNELDFSMEDVIAGKGHIPVYRALYVDRLLSEHDAIDIRKNREMKSLIRSFNTIKDADYETSQQLSQILRPYQMYGFRWFNVLADCGFGGILADEMGLGKTVQYLSFIDMLTKQTPKENRLPSLVVCPASLIYNWVEEAQRFVPDLSVRAIAGGAKERNLLFKEIKNNRCADLYITSYDLLKRDIINYENIRFTSCVLDEAQYIKNLKTSAAKSVKVLQAKHRFVLTGTPIENRLSEIWSIFDFLMPGLLYDHKTFEQRFEIPIMKKKDQEANTRLKKIISPFILRRLKSDVLKDLPDKLEEIRYAQMEQDQRRLYDGQVVELKTFLASASATDKIAILAQLTKLRQICCDPSLLFEDYKGESAKRQACMELIHSAIDGNHRILVFSQFTSMLALLEKGLENDNILYYKITGSTPKKERLDLVNQFNHGDVPVFLISLKAGGTGLNLTGADIVIHYDPWWNFAAQNQATDRAHRIGQQKEVTVYKLIARDTIEEKILDLQNTKKDLADSLINESSESIMRFSTEELLEILS